MSVNHEDVYRVRTSIAFVKRKNILEMFKTNIREDISIEIDYDDILSLILSFDGVKTVGSIYDENKFLNKSDFMQLVQFLNDNHILIHQDSCLPEEMIGQDYRLINTIEDYCNSNSDILSSVEALSNKVVLIVGMGAVGTWVVENLARSGVKNFIIVDNDEVDISNIHRQNLFFEDDVGLKKIDCVYHRIKKIDQSIIIKKIERRLDNSFFYDEKINFDLAINCADHPSVDYTSLVIGEECMLRRVPHLVGGGYNLHLTLIGQTVIPGMSACIKCFESTLKEINNADLDGVYKLKRESRKIGSFGPLCSLSASITSLEAFKVLINKNEALNNINKRIEFNTNKMDFSIREIPRLSGCEWCGENGKYSNFIDNPVDTY